MADSSPATALLQAKAVQWVDTENWPWVVEVEFTDADGQVHSIVDKVPLFTFEDGEPGPATTLPVPVLLDCTVLSSDRSGTVRRISVAHRSVSEEGRAEFVVPSQAVLASDEARTR